MHKRVGSSVTGLAPSVNTYSPSRVFIGTHTPVTPFIMYNDEPIVPRRKVFLVFGELPKVMVPFRQKPFGKEGNGADIV